MSTAPKPFAHRDRMNPVIGVRMQDLPTHDLLAAEAEKVGQGPLAMFVVQMIMS